ncbi:hypothetical protein D3C81_952640 [compost metagenome]
MPNHNHRSAGRGLRTWRSEQEVERCFDMPQQFRLGQGHPKPLQLPPLFFRRIERLALV